MKRDRDQKRREKQQQASQENQTHDMNESETPQPLAIVPLKQFHLTCWPTSQVIQLCDLATAGVPPYKLWTHSVHDIVRVHGIPK
jgi:hypothetical protein